MTPTPRALTTKSPQFRSPSPAPTRVRAVADPMPPATPVTIATVPVSSTSLLTAEPSAGRCGPPSLTGSQEPQQLSLILLFAARKARRPAPGVRLSALLAGCGYARVLRSDAVDSYQLGKWVNRQRINHTKHTLEADREHRLEHLKDWTWGAYADQWEEGFRRLLDYVERHGDAASRWPTRWMASTSACGSTRNATLVKGTLGTDREHRLKDLHRWTWNPHAERWDEGLARLLDCVERHGDANVPRDYGLAQQGISLRGAS